MVLSLDGLAHQPARRSRINVNSFLSGDRLSCRSSSLQKHYPCQGSLAQSNSGNSKSMWRPQMALVVYGESRNEDTDCGLVQEYRPVENPTNLAGMGA
jgi:hypothetical protein